jgi:hypothetical protein
MIIGLVLTGSVLSYIGIIIGLFNFNTCGPSTIKGFAGGLLTYMIWGAVIIFLFITYLKTCFYKCRNDPQLR